MFETRNPEASSSDATLADFLAHHPEEFERLLDAIKQAAREAARKATREALTR